MTTEQIVRVLMAERDKLIAYALSITGDFSLCEDVVQEVALLAMSRVGEIADEARLGFGFVKVPDTRHWKPCATNGGPSRCCPRKSWTSWSATGGV